MATPGGQIDIIATKILLDAQQATAELKRYGVAVDEAARKTETAKALIGKISSDFGVGFKQAGIVASKFASDLGMTENQVKKLGIEMESVGGKGKGAFEKVLSSTNILNIAFGILASTLIRNVLGAFQQMVQVGIKGLKELESAMFNIENAERKLSKMGIEISTTGLKQIISDVKELDKTLSDFQATELVSVLASKVAPALGLGEDNVASLARSITILALRNKSLGKSFEEVESQAITALLSGRVTQGINQLGVKINEQIVLEEALRLRLVESESAYKDLNAQAQERVNVLAIQSILEKNVAEEIESIPRYMQTVTGLSGQLSAEWTDILTKIGQQLSPLIKEVLALLIEMLESSNDWLEKNKDGLAILVNSLASIVSSLNEVKSTSDLFSASVEDIAAKRVELSKFQEVLVGIKEGFVSMLMTILKFIPGIGVLIDALIQLKKSVEGLASIKEGIDGLVSVLDQKIPGLKQKWDEIFDPPSPETPTGVPPPPPLDPGTQKKAEEAAKKLQDIYKENAEKLADIERDYKRKIEDINRDYNEKLADIARNSARAREDAARNYAEKVEDIERDAAEKIAEAQEDYRKKEIDREAEYQRKLRDLREKFLFDLEDALRERDARQVLRLMRQYNLDKRNLEERRQLERQEAAQNLAEKLQDIELEKQKKLEAAKREYEEKLAEIKRGEARERAEAARWKQRQLEDARIWYQRQLADQREFLRRKLADLQQAYAQQLAMQQQMQNALNQTSGVLGYNTSSGGNSGVLGYNTSSGGSFSPFSQNSGFRPYGFAEGGTLIAKRPTVAMFGEGGAEMVNFTPLNKSGTNIGKVFGDIGGLGGAGGQISLRVMLSEGLIAEIVDTSMNNVASHIEYTRRSA